MNDIRHAGRVFEGQIYQGRRIAEVANKLHG